MIIDGGVCVDTVRMARIVDPHTGDIILRGAGASRLSQAMAAGLISEELRQDVETVRRENRQLSGRLEAAEMERKVKARQISTLRLEKLEQYERGAEWLEERKELGEIAVGWFVLGVAVGAAVVTVVAALLM